MDAAKEVTFTGKEKRKRRRKARRKEMKKLKKAQMMEEVWYGFEALILFSMTTLLSQHSDFSSLLLRNFLN